MGGGGDNPHSNGKGSPAFNQKNHPRTITPKSPRKDLWKIRWKITKRLFYLGQFSIPKRTMPDGHP